MKSKIDPEAETPGGTRKRKDFCCDGMFAAACEGTSVFHFIAEKNEDGNYYTICSICKQKVRHV